MRGSVQGVGFRMAAADQARRLAIGGSARNRFDGTVEVEAEGDPGSVATMASWLARGPDSARVDGVDEESVEPRGQQDFRIA